MSQKDLEKEKLEEEYARFKELSKSVFELSDLRKANAEITSELFLARKLVNSLKEQMKTGQAKHQEEIYKFTDRLRIETETVIALREEVENTQKTANDLQSTIKQLRNSNSRLIEANLDLDSKMKAYETVMNSEYQKLLKVLCMELDICKNRLNTLVTNCIAIYEERDFDTSSLVWDAGISTGEFNSIQFLNFQ